MKSDFFQFFILGCEGESLKANPNLSFALRQNLGGVIFFTKNISTESSFVKFVNEIKESAQKNIFLSIDQEGGRVERTENLYNGKKYKSAAIIAKEGEKALIKQTEQIASDLRKFGLNMNFAPVCDVNSNPKNPIIGERAFSSDTKEVSHYAKIVADIYLKNGIIPVAKHFPGHGDTAVDSHLELPTVDMDFDDFKNIHIQPFIDNINIPAIMVSHVHCKMFDKEVLPASLSKNVIENYLIKKLNYQGTIISDDMVMGALNKYDPVEKIIRGIDAGISMFIYRDSDDTTIDTIEAAAKECFNSKVLSNKMESSLERIYRTKKLCYDY